VLNVGENRKGGVLFEKKNCVRTFGTTINLQRKIGINTEIKTIEKESKNKTWI